jgi:hypothetical protein
MAYIPCILDEVKQSNSVKQQLGPITMPKILGPPKRVEMTIVY